MLRGFHSQTLTYANDRRWSSQLRDPPVSRRRCADRLDEAFRVVTSSALAALDDSDRAGDDGPAETAVTVRNLVQVLLVVVLLPPQ